MKYDRNIPTCSWSFQCDTSSWKEKRRIDFLATFSDVLPVVLYVRPLPIELYIYLREFEMQVSQKHPKHAVEISTRQIARIAPLEIRPFPIKRFRISHLNKGGATLTNLFFLVPTPRQGGIAFGPLCSRVDQVPTEQQSGWFMTRWHGHRTVWWDCKLGWSVALGQR